MSVDISAKVFENFVLRNPFWVASAHYSDNESAIRQWKSIKPAALTLKTSHKSPPQEVKHPDSVRQITAAMLPRFGRSLYCDGVKQKELLTYEATAKLLACARESLPDTLVGISVVSGPEQDYSELRETCKDASFCELNLKYGFRLAKDGQTDYLSTAVGRFAEVLEDIERFLKSFHGVPVFIKIPREMTWLPGTKQLKELLALLSAHKQAGLIVANSRKLDVPEFIYQGREVTLCGGVMCGETLFDQTVELVRAFSSACAEARIPIIATGGVIDPEQSLTVLRAGATCVQLCTAFAYNGFNYYETLCWNLQSRVEQRGLRDLSGYVSRLRSEGVAGIYTMPFMYLEEFWSDETQRRIKADISRSRRMDVFVMSGRTLVERWHDQLKRRFEKNLGANVFLPDVEAGVFESIQRSWGWADAAELQVRKDRVRKATELIKQLWSDTASPRLATAKQESTKESAFELLLYQQCPFYSFYLFDDKVYIAPYPLSNPGQLESPVYVFFAGSREYLRLEQELQRLKGYARQRTVDLPQLTPDSPATVNSSG